MEELTQTPILWEWLSAGLEAAVLYLSPTSTP